MYFLKNRKKSYRQEHEVGSEADLFSHSNLVKVAQKALIRDLYRIQRDSKPPRPLKRSLKEVYLRSITAKPSLHFMS